MENKWALILGASSGFGGATCKKLASEGYHIFGVHMDRKATMANVESIIEDIKSHGRQAEFFNINAADPDKRKTVIDRMKELAPKSVKVLMHSIAFGALLPVISSEKSLTQKQVEMTFDVMANSLLYWTQDLVSNDLFDSPGRIFAMTSIGSSRVWDAYGAVSGAKAALESHCRQLALELAPKNITANAILAGVTDTPALRKIPGNDKMIEKARAVNPMGRTTTPEDVANVIAAMCSDNFNFVTGNTLFVDGGENITG